jgi:hypothetical protein
MCLFLFNKKAYFLYIIFFLFLLDPLWLFTDRVANQKVDNNDPEKILLNFYRGLYSKKLNKNLPIKIPYKDNLNR